MDKNLSMQSQSLDKHIINQSVQFKVRKSIQNNLFNAKYNRYFRFLFTWHHYYMKSQHKLFLQSFLKHSLLINLYKNYCMVWLGIPKLGRKRTVFFSQENISDVYKSSSFQNITFLCLMWVK